MQAVLRNNGEPSFGLLLPTREFVMTGHQTVRPLLDLAEAAEQAGFDSVWAGDSFAARPRVDPLVLLSAVAGRTTSLTLGTAVLLGSLRHPIPTAHAIASLDRLSQGRLILGLGAGFPYPATEAEFQAAGIPFKQRIGRLTETIRLWRAIWGSEEPVSFQGKYWQIEDLRPLPLPERPGGPLLLLAGEGQQALKRAGELVGGWLTYSPTPVAFGEHWEAVQGAARAAGQPDPISAVYMTITLDEDQQRARHILDQYLTAYYGFGAEVIGQIQALYAGGEAGFKEWIADYLQAGPRHVIIRLGVLDQYDKALERLAPLVHKLRTSARAHR
jgi:alkanesulfonate monooxygenase SsuD/methylene tetrahydromethanopterin reductase-like flavin-dependent oxidoreductase (luciferase family)